MREGALDETLHLFRPNPIVVEAQKLRQNAVEDHPAGRGCDELSANLNPNLLSQLNPPQLVSQKRFPLAAEGFEILILSRFPTLRNAGEIIGSQNLFLVWKSDWLPRRGAKKIARREHQILNLLNGILGDR